MNQRPKTILVVDDDKAIRRLLTKLLQREYQVLTAETGEEALEIAAHLEPDLVLLDIVMLGMDGYETCRRLRRVVSDRVQIIMVSAESSRRGQELALDAGAQDYVIKPFDARDLESRVQLHFQLREALDRVVSVRYQIDSRNSALKELAAARRKELCAAHDVAAFTLAKVAESRDHKTGEHLIRMRSFTQLLAEQLQDFGSYADQIDDKFLEDLYRSSPLHDIGKVGIPDEILLKPGKFTPDEFKAMKHHTIIGATILDNAVLQSDGGQFLAMAATIARFHHERFDGTGYLAGLVGEEIPLPARIVALADVYDALTSARPYKDAFPADKAKEMIVEESGRHFDPVIVDAFIARYADFLCIPEQANCGANPGLGTMALQLQLGS